MGKRTDDVPPSSGQEIDLADEGMSTSEPPPELPPELVNTATELPESDRDLPTTKPERMVGWNRDAVDPRDRPARAMLGAPVALPNEWLALLAFIFTITNQTITSSCVGQAIGNAIMIRLRALGHTVDEISRMAIYAWARMRAKADVGEKLRDLGSFPRLAIKSIREDGVPKEEDWPFAESKINDELPWDVQQKSSAARVTQFFRVDSVGTALVHDIMNALVQMYPVVFGTFVDSDFMRFEFVGHLADAPVIEKMNAADRNGGGHYMTIVGYRVVKVGAADVVHFLVLNSWSDRWGCKGLCWVHEDVITSSESSDFYVMQVSMSEPKEAA